MRGNIGQKFKNTAGQGFYPKNCARVILFLCSCVAGVVNTGAIYPSPYEGGVTKNECTELYAHQLFLMKSPLNPISPALKQNEESLNSQKSREAQIQECLKSVSRKSYLCQRNAMTPLELLRCIENGSKEIAVASDREKSPAPLKTEKKPELKVSVESCRNAYDHLLSVYSSSKILPEGDEGKQLLKYWRSIDARESFYRRCTNVFQDRDITCILKTSDTAVIQACLVNVPPEN